MTLQLPGYRDFQLVGEGGLGRVYRGVRESTGGLVAVKELRDIAEASPAWHRARRELDAMLRLKGHPYVVSVEEIVEGPNGPCLVMEYVPGGSLMDRLSHGVLSPAEVVLVGQQVAQALSAAHQVGMVHRDVKPHNLLVGQFGQVKVCDFGIAALARGAGLQTQTQALTLGYASPEALDGDAPVGPPADVFSFGATMVHLMTGRKPSMQDRLGGGKLELQTSDPGLVPVVSLLNACMSHRPDERPTMATVSATFERAAIDLGGRRITALAALGATDERTVVRAPVTQLTVLPAAAPTVVHPVGGAPDPHLITAPPLPGAPAAAGAPWTAVHPTVQQQPISTQQPVVPVVVQMQPPPRRAGGAAAALWGVLAAGVVMAVIAVVMLTRSGGDTAAGESSPAAVATTTAPAPASTVPATAAPATTAAAPAPAPAVVPETAPPLTLPPQTVPPVTAAPVTAPPPVVLPFDLGLATLMTQPACDGSFVTMVGSATNPSTYAQVVQVVLDQYPGSAYMHTLSTCSSLSPYTRDGSMIYSVYFGPFRTLAEACDARRFGPTDAYVRVLDNVTPSTSLTSCG